MEALMYAQDTRPSYQLYGRKFANEDTDIQLFVGVTSSYLPIPETLDGAIQAFAESFKTWGSYDTVTVTRIDAVSTNITPTTPA